MTPTEIRALQQTLLEQGFYEGRVDGIWGPLSAAAMAAAMRAMTLRQISIPPHIEAPGVGTAAPPLAWQGRVTPVFANKVRAIADEMLMPPREGANWLMACMAFETAETFRSDVRNGAGSGAVGLIQFMPRTAEELGVTTEQLARMMPETQLDYVYKYFRPYRGRLRTLSDTYMAILWPAAIGKPESHVLWSSTSHPTTYRQNVGLDVDGNWSITKAEAAAKVADKLARGLRYA